MQYFKLIEVTIQNVREEFRRLCLKLHPDKGGNEFEFKEMQAEYERLTDRLASGEKAKAEREERKTDFTSEGEKAIAEIISRLMTLNGIVIEVCGSWLWLDGKTWENKPALDELGFRWSRAKKRMYWSPYLSGKYKRRGCKSMSKIRSEYGSDIYETGENQYLGAA